MLKNVSLFLLLLFQIIGFSQIPKHAKWSASSKTISDKMAEIHIKVQLDPHWHIWSLNPGDESLIPPTISFDPNKDIKLIGKPTEHGKMITKTEEGYDHPLHMYEGEVTYIQKVTYNKPSDLKGTVEFQICDEHSCMPPTTENFNTKLAVFTAEKKDSTIVKPNKELVAVIDTITNPIADIATTSEDTISVENNSDFGVFGKTTIDCQETSQLAGLTEWTALLAGILGGFAALFFPCTFPMIPMTMSFFLKGNQDNKKKGIWNAIFYGFSIFLVYFLLSLPFLFLGWSSDTLNDLSTNAWLNIAFFVLFIFFAFSLFGFYDISMPSSLANKIDSKSNVGSYIGIFFMALTLAIVSFSCTGPILGLVLGNLKNAKLIMPAMSGFGIGLGIPFALFAIFPNMMKSLPKSGSWLDVIKVVFGFIELAFAFKFLSNADLVKQWGLLKRESFIVIWIIIFLLLGLYLLGKFAIKKGYTIKKTMTSTILGILSLCFVIYLMTDFFGGELRLLSGFPPPKSYSLVHQEEKFDTHKNQYEAALSLAKSQNKPLFIDFTGWACVNCRKMEENVWIQPEVYDLMKNKFVIVSLYVDEKTELPKEQQYFSKNLGKQVVTVGNKWTDFEITNIHQVTQPLYVIINSQTGQIINKPVGGFMDKKNFLSFLTCGLKGMNN